MEVHVAKSAGFCFGVERAYDMVQKAVQDRKNDEKVSTFGPLIHNNRVMKELEQEQVSILEDQEKAQETVIIRSHGTSKKRKKVLEEKAEKVLDATCPYVSKVHIITQKFQEEGIQIIVVGDPQHPEMRGIMEDLKIPLSVQNLEEAEALPYFEKLGVVCQTTLRKDRFDEICEILKTKCDEIIIDDTICTATTDRQGAIRELAQEVDAMIVIGGTQSSNTKKLAEIAREYCPVQKVESIDEIDVDQFKGMKVLGVSAGASTPQRQIDELVDFLEKL